MRRVIDPLFFPFFFYLFNVSVGWTTRYRDRDVSPFSGKKSDMRQCTLSEAIEGKTRRDFSRLIEPLQKHNFKMASRGRRPTGAAVFAFHFAGGMMQRYASSDRREVNDQRPISDDPRKIFRNERGFNDT